VREIDDLPATVWWGVQVRQSSLHIAQCIARVQESCAALMYTVVHQRHYVILKICQTEPKLKWLNKKKSKCA
jgi:hypothetical protein